MALAVAPVPQAQVSPLPLSHTRIWICVRSITRINSEFTRSGIKRSWNSKDGPIFSRSRLSISSIKYTAWGFPTSIPVNSHCFPSTKIVSGSWEVRTASPMSTVSITALPFSTSSFNSLIPAGVSTVRLLRSGEIIPWS